VHLALSQSAATLRDVRAGMLHDRGSGDRGGSPTCSGSRSTCGTWRSASSETSSRITSEYAAATPNPCLRCNEKINVLGDDRQGRWRSASTRCDGHYARSGRCGRDRGRSAARAAPGGRSAKDQSYVLGGARRGAAGTRLLHWATRRSRSPRRGRRSRSTIARSHDSHDICFIPDGDTRAGSVGPRRGGPATSSTSDGSVLGRQLRGLRLNGRQRKGLRRGPPGPDGQARTSSRYGGPQPVVVGTADLSVSRAHR
jgi:tRNA-specific 2-thiouridylase